MKQAYLLLSCLGTLAMSLGWGVTSPTSAQIVPDRTIPNPSTVLSNGSLIVIRGGIQRGHRLFYSFQSFSVPSGRTASFRGIPLAVTDIHARVTGNKPSRINGRIEALQSDGRVTQANLVLSNFNGFISGQNASLTIGGTFRTTQYDSSFSQLFPPPRDLPQISTGRSINVLLTRDTPQMVTRRCSASKTSDEFIITGRGGLPRTPDDALSSSAIVSPEWVTLDSTDTETPEGSSEVESLQSNSAPALAPDSASSIVEANAWRVDAHNNVVLVAQSQPLALVQPQINSDCSGRSQ